MTLHPMAASGEPVEPDRATARQWAVEELLGQEYRDAEPNILERAILEAIDFVLDAIGRSGGVSPGYGLAVGLVIVVVLLAVALLVAGPVRRTARRRTVRGGVFTSQLRSAAGHRAAAEAAAAAGDLSLAVQERFRAVARSLEERVVLDPRPGRTADEVASEAADLLGGVTDELRVAARAFDDVTYGERTGTEASYAQVVAADKAVARARPAVARAAEPVGLP